MQDIAIIIPSRIGSTRLANKPLLQIGHLSMIERVALAAKQTGISDVYVATDSQEIAQLASKQNVAAIMTDSALPSGTDRVFAACQEASLQHKVIVNLQGDMPFIEPKVILDVAKMCLESDYDITTAVAIADLEYATSQSNVKAVIAPNGRALYFSRSLIPHGNTQYFCHIGIYAFKQQALKKFCQLPVSNLEIAEKLEQLRALENGMSIGACFAQSMPISVDTSNDLALALKLASAC